ncbi:MAG: rane protein [Acidimicrobiaceae bacterium]
MGVALDVQKRFGELQGGQIAAFVTLSLFLSLFPLMLMATAVLGFLASGKADLAGDIVNKLGVSGEAAKTVQDAIVAAERSRKSASVVGFLGLLWASLGVVSSMQAAIDRAWQAKGRGMRDKLYAVEWLVGAGILMAASFVLTGLVVGVLPGWAAPVGILVTVALNILLFWWTFKILGRTHVGWRPLLPGALLAGIGLQVLTTFGAYYVPRAVASSSALYGSIGVVFALLAWLFFFGRLVVYASVLNVVLYERKAGTVTVDVEVPRVPGEVPTGADRSGVVSETVPAPT